jgi:hypothetical protein
MNTLQRLDRGRAVARLYAIAVSLANRLRGERADPRPAAARRLLQ